MRDVDKGEANLTEVRFQIFALMLQKDEQLVKRVKEYLKLEGNREGAQNKKQP